MPDAPYLRPFVLDVDASEPRRVGTVDLYRPVVTGRVPLVVLIHGGPMRTQPTVPPTRWPVYTGYAGLLTGLGLAVAMFDHGLLNGNRDGARADLQGAIDTARRCEGVDPDRVLLWCFSGGGVLASAYLHAPPAWLRGIAFSYAVLDDDDPALDPRAAIRPELALPLLLTRVGHENPGLVDGQQQFVAKAERLDIPLTIIDVPHAGHAFDNAEPTTESQDAIQRAAQWVRSSSTAG